jgi:hypothetical protein
MWFHYRQVSLYKALGFSHSIQAKKLCSCGLEPRHEDICGMQLTASPNIILNDLWK